MNIRPSPMKRRMIWSWTADGGRFAGALGGTRTRYPICTTGVMTMKMMSRTRTTSTSGVTLMSAFSPAFCSLPTELCHRCLIMRPCFLHEVDRHFRSGVRHLDGEAVDAVLEVVVGPDRGDGDEEA